MPSISEMTTPPVTWAQRKDTLLLNIHVPDCESPEITVEESLVKFTGTSSDGKKYAVDLELFKEIDEESLTKTLTGRLIHLNLKKKDKTEPYWKCLLKGNPKLGWLKVDFNQWVDEDDSGDEGFGGGFGGDMDFGNMGMGNMGMGGLGDNDMDDDDDMDSDDEDLPDLEPAVGEGAGEAKDKQLEEDGAAESKEKETPKIPAVPL